MAPTNATARRQRAVDVHTAPWWVGSRQGLDGPTVSAKTRRTMLDRAAGALMLRYGFGSHMALSMLLRWARDTGADLETVASTLVRDICHEGLAESSDPDLGRWIEGQLREDRVAALR